MEVHRGPRALARLTTALGEPTRARVYELVRQASRPVSRTEVAASAGIGTRLAAFHLDKLVAAGLLTAHYARPAHRPSGPGAGRPAKWYSSSAARFDITVPPRRLDLPAHILLRTLSAAPPSSRQRRRMLTIAREAGQQLASASHTAELHGVLADVGYEPRPRPDQGIDLVNCPFHELVLEGRDLVCRLNLALIEGILDQLPSRYAPLLDPQDGRCCVHLQART